MFSENLDKNHSSPKESKKQDATGTTAITSDQNCASSCGLHLGADHNFESQITEQQDILDKKGRKVNPLGLTGKEYDRFLPVLKDVILNIFTDPNEEKIFKKALDGMFNKFPDTLDGSKKTLSLFPDKFDFDSRIELHNPVLVDLLDELKRTQKDFKEIEKFIRLIKPQAAEELVFNSLSRFFYNHRGMFLHSLKLDQYLKIFVDLSTQERKNQSIGPQLTPLEEKIKEAFRITEESLNDPGDAVIGYLKTPLSVPVQTTAPNMETTPHVTPVPIVSTAVPPTISFLGQDIKIALRETQKKSLTNIAKGKFKDKDVYSEEEIRSILRICKFQLEAKFPGENDFLTILADLKLFVCVEVKCQVDTKAREAKSALNPQTHGLPNLDGNLKSAAHQLKKNAYHMAKMHAPILSRGWKFLKVAGIFPDVINKQKMCAHCRKWVLTEDIIKQPGGLQKWWEGTGILEEIGKLYEQRKQEGYNDFLILFNRYINLSRIGLQKVIHPKAWEQVQGSNPSYISAGYTSAQTSAASINKMGFKEAQNRPNDAFKILCYEPDQEDLLKSIITRMIFLCDFGAGMQKMHYVKTRN